MVAQKQTSIITEGRIEELIYFFRGQRVMLDRDLARLFGLATSRLNEQVKRNLDRFPEDFMFQLDPEEESILRSHFAISSKSHGGRRYAPYVFTEHGTVMLANVLRSPTAIQASIQVVRAFIRLRKMLATHKEIERQVEALEKKYDRQFVVVFQAIRELMASPKKKTRPIGFGNN